MPVSALTHPVPAYRRRGNRNPSRGELTDKRSAPGTGQSCWGQADRQLRPQLPRVTAAACGATGSALSGRVTGSRGSCTGDCRRHGARRLLTTGGPPGRPTYRNTYRNTEGVGLSVPALFVSSAASDVFRSTIPRRGSVSSVRNPGAAAPAAPSLTCRRG